MGNKISLVYLVYSIPEFKMALQIQSEANKLNPNVPDWKTPDRLKVT